MHCVCVVHIKMWIYLLFPLNSQSQLRHALFSHYWATFSFSFFYPPLLWRIFTGRKPWHFLLYIHFLHLLVVSTGKRWERGGPKQKMHTDISRDSQAERLLFLTMLCTLATNTKKVLLFWHQCFGHKIPTPVFFLFLFIFCRFPIANFSWSKSQSFSHPDHVFLGTEKKVGLL